MCNFYFETCLKLIDKSQVVFVEYPYIWDAESDAGYSLYPHTEREAGDLFGVVVDIAEHIWINSTRPQDLEPTGVRAGSAFLCPAQTVQEIIDLGTRLGEGGRSGGRKSHSGLLAEHLPGKRSIVPLSIR